MPDQELSPSGQRSAELQRFDKLPASLKCQYCLVGLRPPFSHRDCHGVRGVSSSPSYSKESDGKMDLSSGEVCVRVPLTGVQAGRVMAEQSDAGGAAPDIQPRQGRGRPLKVLSKNPKRCKSLSTAKETDGDVSQTVKSCHQSGGVKVEKVSTAGAKTSSGPAGYRGVRVRPGVNGYLVEIRPRRWKKTIWLGTYNTLLEAARAYDAGFFYTKKNTPFNFQDSKGSFPELPRHLTLSDSDPNFDELKLFVKKQAVQAANSGRLLAQARRKEIASSRSGLAAVLEGEGANWSSSEKANKDGGVVQMKEEQIDSLSQHTEDGYGDLDPLVALRSAPAAEGTLCWEERAQSDVRNEVGEAARTGDGSPSPPIEDSQASLFDPWHFEDQQIVATNGDVEDAIAGDESSRTNEDPTNLSAIHSSWPFQPFELDVNDHAVCEQAGYNGKEGSKLNQCSQKMCFPSFGIDPPDALLIPQSWVDSRIMSGSLDKQYFSDDELLFDDSYQPTVYLWSHMDDSYKAGQERSYPGSLL